MLKSSWFHRLKRSERLFDDQRFEVIIFKSYFFHGQLFCDSCRSHDSVNRRHTSVNYFNWNFFYYFSGCYSDLFWCLFDLGDSLNWFFSCFFDWCFFYWWRQSHLCWYLHYFRMFSSSLECSQFGGRSVANSLFE